MHADKLEGGEGVGMVLFITRREMPILGERVNAITGAVITPMHTIPFTT
jgi:hypothetical protein